MNIKKIFGEDQKSFLDSAKASFLAKLEEGAKEVITEKTKESQGITEEREKLLIKISGVGQSGDLEKLGKAKADVDPMDYGRTLMDLTLELKIAEKELETLQNAFKEMFADEPKQG